MCGKDMPLFKTEIEGTAMNVCSSCSRFGKVLQTVTVESPREKKKKEKKKTSAIRAKKEEPEVMEIIVDNFAELTRKKREQLGLKQEEMAKLLAEKESLLHKIETGVFEPSVPLARKLEKLLHIILVEEHTEEHTQPQKTKSETLTLGDMVKIRKRQP